MREQTERVLADPLFGNSKRYSHLLKFIVDRTLDGVHDDLKERIIGTEVFGRPAEYDTSLDPTVRVVANEVRKRLALYYAEPGRDQELRIDIPVRSYVARFTQAKQSPAQAAPQTLPGPAAVPVPIPISDKATRSKRFRYFGATAAVAAAAFAAWILYRFLSPVPLVDRFWAPIVQNGSGPVLICLSTSPSTNPLPAQTQAPSGMEQPGMPLYEFSARRVNVAMTDVYAANALTSFLRQRGRDSVQRPSQITSLEDLRSSPAVFLGSYSNDWALRLGADLHFKFRTESDLGRRWIEDSSNPSSRSWSVDLSAPYEQVKDDYALVTRALDPTTGQWWIGIGGTTGLGTLAANRLVMDPKAMAAFVAHLPKRWERRNLQVVLDIKVVQGSPGATRVVATYSW